MLPKFCSPPLMCPPIKAEPACLAWHEGPREQLQPSASQTNPWLTTRTWGRRGASEKESGEACNIMNIFDQFLLLMVSQGC